MSRLKTSPYQNSNNKKLEITTLHAAELAIRHGYAEQLSYTASVPEHLLAMAREKGVALKKQDKAVLREDIQGARQFVLRVKIPPETPIDRVSSNALEQEKPSRIVLLDHVFDPHNLGAMFRSAAEFSIDLLVFPRRRSATITETVCSVSAGAVFTQPYACIQSCAAVLKHFDERQFTIVGTDVAGYPLPSYSFAQRSVLVLGTEGKGISEMVKKKCHHIISIPTSHRVDSLNLSVAAGICMYAWRNAPSEQ